MRGLPFSTPPMRLMLPLSLEEPRALTDAAVRFAEQLGAELLVLHVMPPLGGAPLLPETGLGFDTTAYLPFDSETRREIERALLGVGCFHVRRCRWRCWRALWRWCWRNCSALPAL